MDGEQHGRLRQNLVGIVAFTVAALIAVSVVGFVIAGGDDDNAGPADDGFPELDGSSPTPFPDTGVLSPNRPAVGEPAPDFRLTDVRDETVLRALSDFHGTPVVLNWYASWCGPCRAEIPTFQRAQTELGEESVVFFAVDFLESRDDALGILDELGATYPAVLDSNGAVSAHYRTSNTLPSTFFIDAEGTLVAQHLGPIDEGQLIELLARIGVEWVPAEA